jgi:alpha-glucoside transport system substrate-binding protein
MDRLSVEILTDPNATFRFDGSDQMPSAVGAGTFWQGIVDWIAKDKPAADVTRDIQNNWPK